MTEVYTTPFRLQPTGHKPALRGFVMPSIEHEYIAPRVVVNPQKALGMPNGPGAAKDKCGTTC